jgi:flagellar motor switch protein FliN
MADNLENLADKLASESDAMSGDGSAVDELLVDPTKDKNLQMIMDIPLKVTVELGRSRMPVNDLLKLVSGSVIELAKLAGEPMEVFVNGKMIARGEAVVVNEKFGIRLTDVISTKERVESVK